MDVKREMHSDDTKPCPHQGEISYPAMQVPRRSPEMACCELVRFPGEAAEKETWAGWGKSANDDVGLLWGGLNNVFEAVGVMTVT